jgi:general secretion pathway protein N
MQFKIGKSGRQLIYIGLIAYVVFLLVTIPASFLTGYILPSVQSARGVKLSSVHGSIWKGYAVDASVNQFNLGKLDWTLNGWGLLLGDVDLKLKFKNDTGRGSGYVSLGFSGALNAEDVDLQFPSEALQPLLYGLPISFSGDLRGNIKSMEIRQGKVFKNEGRIVWQSAALRAPQNIELGSFLITLEPVNNDTKVKITDEQQGPVVADIGIMVKANGEYRLNGWLQARDESQQHITEALRLIGRADNTGKFWVSYNGQMRGR